MPLADISKLQLNFHKMLQDMQLNILVHELEEISRLHKYKISLIM